MVVAVAVVVAVTVATGMAVAVAAVVAVAMGVATANGKGSGGGCGACHQHGFRSKFAGGQAALRHWQLHDGDAWFFNASTLDIVASTPSDSSDTSSAT